MPFVPVRAVRVVSSRPHRGAHDPVPAQLPALSPGRQPSARRLHVGTEHLSPTPSLHGLGLGLNVHTSDTVSWQPEVTAWHEFNGVESLVCVLGLGVSVGSQPDYSDLAPR